MSGSAEPVTSVAGQARAYAAYFLKFPFTRQLLVQPPDAVRLFGKAAAHLFRPSFIRYQDNSLGIGTRFGLRLAQGRPLGPPELETT